MNKKLLPDVIYKMIFFSFFQSIELFYSKMHRKQSFHVTFVNNFSLFAFFISMRKA